MQTVKTPVLALEYGWQGRRIRKTVRDGSQVVLTDEKFCYEGWNLLAVLNGTNGNGRVFCELNRQAMSL